MFSVFCSFCFDQVWSKFFIRVLRGKLPLPFSSTPSASLVPLSQGDSLLARW